MKRWSAAAAVALVLIGMAAGATARETLRHIEVQYRGIALMVDGKRLVTDGEPFVVVSEGRTYIPARALAEALGARVGWDDSTSTIHIYTPNHWEAKTENGVTTYSFPYYSASIQWPAGGKASAPRDVLLHVDSAGGILNVARTHANTLTDVHAAADAFVAGMAAEMPLSVTDTRPIALPGAVGAVDIKATATLPNLSAAVRIRVIQTPTGVWYLTVLYQREETGRLATAAEQALASFTFR